MHEYESHQPDEADSGYILIGLDHVVADEDEEREERYRHDREGIERRHQPWQHVRGNRKRGARSRILCRPQALLDHALTSFTQLRRSWCNGIEPRLRMGRRLDGSLRNCPHWGD